MRERARVRHRRDVGVVRALADVARREAREAGAVLEEPLEMRNGHELRVRLAVHVDELGEDELHAPFLELGAQLVGRGSRLDGHAASDSWVRCRAAMDRCARPGRTRVCDVHTVREGRATLQAVIESVSSAAGIERILADVVDIATEATGCYAALVYLLDGDRLILRAASPVHAHLVGVLSMGTDEGVTGWVSRTGQPAFLRENAIADPRHKYFPELEEDRFQSMAAVPVRSRTGDVVGVIVLHTAAPHEFDEEVLAFLGHTAALLGGAVEHAELYADASARVRELTTLTSVSEALAAATELDAIGLAATSGARTLLGASLCQLFRLDAGRELRPLASDPADTPPPRPRSGALLLELLGRRERDGASGGLWPEHEGVLITAPLVASDEQLGLLCCVVDARRGVRPADGALLGAIANQTAMALQRADLIARLTARDRVKDLLDALAAGSPTTAIVRAGPPGLNLQRPHVFLHGVSVGAGAQPDWEAVAGRLLARIHDRDRLAFLDAGVEALRGVAILPDEDVPAVVALCDELAAGEGIALGISGLGRDSAGGRRGLHEAADAAAIAQALRPQGGALGFDELGAYRYLVHLDLDEPPRDRHWAGVEALLEHDRRRNTALVETLEQYLARRRSVVETARALYIHPNTLRQRLGRIERVAGLDIQREDLLALELAVKLVRLHQARQEIRTGR
jgi:GAF domain-containing protein